MELERIPGKAPCIAFQEVLQNGGGGSPPKLENIMLTALASLAYKDLMKCDRLEI